MTKKNEEKKFNLYRDVYLQDDKVFREIYVKDNDNSKNKIKKKRQP